MKSEDYDIKRKKYDTQIYEIKSGNYDIKKS